MGKGHCMREGEEDRTEDGSCNKKGQRLFKYCSKSPIEILEKGVKYVQS